MVASEGPGHGLPAGLPGTTHDPGSGPVVDALVEALLDDAAALPAGAPIGAVLARHREHRRAWYEQLVGPLLVPVEAVELLRLALLPGDHALRVVLVADPGQRPLSALRRAAGLLTDDDRVQWTPSD